MSSSAFISVKDLCVSYGRKQALANISFDVRLGSFVGLVGSNGAGKSTLLRVLAGLDVNYRGSVHIDNTAPGEHTKSLVAYMPDSNFYYKHHTVHDVFHLYERLFPDFSSQRARKFFDQLGIENTALISSLSKGQNERLAIALTMARKASVYLLDEPFSGVDPGTRAMIAETIIQEFKMDSTVLLSTHMINEIEHMFDEVVILHEGRLQVACAAEDLRSQYGHSIESFVRGLTL